MTNLDPTCNLTGFLHPNQTTCLLCRPGYYLQENACISEPADGYFFHNETGSYQSNRIIFLLHKSNANFSLLECQYGLYYVMTRLLNLNQFY